MNRNEMILAALVPAKGDTHTPTQVQKLCFLLDDRLGSVLGGPVFDFVPGSYGPQDLSIYKALQALANEGLVAISHCGPNKAYRLTVRGQIKGFRALLALEEPVRNYFYQLSEWARSLSFSQLVSAIYKAYPEMRANAVFQQA